MGLVGVCELRKEHERGGSMNGKGGTDHGAFQKSRTQVETSY